MTRLLVSLLLAAAPVCAGVAAVWAVHDGEKVERGRLDNPNKSGNTVWDGERIRLFGARNEVIAFQVIVESDGSSIEELRCSADIEAGPVRIFSQNYMFIPAPGTASWIYRAGTPGAPSNIVGWKPVQLIPGSARAGRGGFPLRLDPERNQGLWIELYIRKDAPEGVQQGEVIVNADDREIRLPLTLEVFGWTLPDENSMHAMFYYETAQPLLYQGANLDEAYHQFAHRHRLELVHAYSEEAAEDARGRFDGSAFTREAGYEGPGENTGNRILPLTFYSPGAAFDQRESAWRRSDAWMSFIDGFLPEAVTFVYMPDEPAPSEYPRIRTIAGNIKSNPGAGSRLPVFVTKQWTAELDGSIDIWSVPPSQFSIERAKTERERGRRYWTYNGGRPFAPAIVIESPATDPRALIWACFKHSVEVYFYWHTNHWRHNAQKPADRIQNVWANPITYDNRAPGRAGSFAYGDGVLLYPGTDILFPEQDRGVEGPIGTIQLANFRRGLQDHLYLSEARRLGLDELVRESLDALVPRVFLETTASAPVAFQEDGNAYEEFRHRLGTAIQRASGER